MSKPLDNVSAEQILGAVVNFYTPADTGAASHDVAGLTDILQHLPALSKDDHIDTIHVQLGKYHPDVVLGTENHAAISFVDDAFTQILEQTDLDFGIESYVRDLAPHAAIIAINEGVKQLTQPQEILTLLDTIMNEGVGWSADLGVLGEQYMEKFQAPIAALISGRTSCDECMTELDALFRKERPLYEKREQQLRESELEVLAGQKALFYSAELLNRQMAGRQLPMFIIFLLQGSWFEFLQRVYITYGESSSQWLNAGRLSEAMIWSLQPKSDPTKQRDIMRDLPDRIRQFCEKLSFDTETVIQSLADLEGEYESIQSGEPGDPCDFDLMDVDSSMGETSDAMDATMRKYIQSLKEDAWFLYDDKSESDEKVARIKLILNWHDSERLLFTNHNRRKVMQMSYASLSGHLKNRTMRRLNPDTSSFKIIGDHLLAVLQKVSKQNKKEKKEQQAAERRELSNRYQQGRKEELLQAAATHQKVAKYKKQRATVLRQKAQQKLDAAINAVGSLKTDAWVKLPIMEGTLTPCKLVAVIAANEHYIFANRAGLKVAEFSASQLANMIVTENSEILDTGAEFESALANVVSGLRENKDKSYDELTGDTG
jgi:hypothetical protein